MNSPHVIENPDFNPGAVIDRVDVRDYKWDEVASVLPPFDWSKNYSVLTEIQSAIGDPNFQIKSKDQGGSGSCGGQAWGYYGASIESIFTKSYEERSAKFIYSQTHVPGGGSAGRDNNNLVIKQGWGLESLTPSYENGLAPGEYFMERNWDITDEARSKAKLSRALSYVTVNMDIDSLAQATKANHGAIIGLVGSNNGTWLSIKPSAPQDTDKLWYHWLYVGAAGMFNGEKALQVMNSWGNVCGDRGWQWITESYLKTVLHNDPIHGNTTIFGSWTLLYNSNPLPSPGFTHHFATYLKQGDQNNEVKSLQTALQITGDFDKSVPITGFYGTITAQAVFRFQMRHNISPTARDHVGPKTIDALNAIFNK